MRKIIFTLVLVSSSGFIAGAVFAYDDQTTHPALMSETVNFYNLYFDNKLTSYEKEWLLKSVTREDTPPRWINHFYDPVYNEGWTGEHGADYVSEEFMQKFSDLILSPERAISAINWVHNQKLQEKYKLYKGNRTWERAIYEYVQHGNKKEAFLTLGYVLHLVQDMTVPDHTRNDTHPGDSPYENYCSQFTVDNFFVADKLIDENYRPASLDSLDDYFEYLASYSNNYFFSKDTINNPKYEKPVIVAQKNGFGYGADKRGINFLLALSNSQWDKGENKYKTEYLLDKNEPSYYPILDAYWTRLSREAVLAGAGVIDLFFKEVQKAQQDPSLLKAPPQPELAIVSLFGEMTRVKRALSSVRGWFRHVIVNIKDATLAFLGSPGVPSGGGPAILVDESDFIDSAGSVEAELPPKEVASPQKLEPKIPKIVASTVIAGEQDLTFEPSDEPSEPAEPIAPPIEQAPALVSEPIPPESQFEPFWTPMVSVSPGAGGGGSSASPGQAPDVVPESEPEDTTPPEPPTIISPESFSQIFTTNTIAFSGTAEASSVISQDFSTAITSASSNWTLELTLDQGTTTINFFATDQSNNTSHATSTTLFVDSVAPTLEFATQECGTEENCLVIATTTTHLYWETSADDLDFYELTINGEISTTTSISSAVILGDNTTNSFSLRAKDKAGNWSNSQNISVEISTSPVVINEVAWAGASNYPNDEWIELYNKTSKAIDLSGWILYSQTDMKPYIKLSGSIPAHGYYLMERKDDNTVSDIVADLIYGNDGSSWAINNPGEILVLSKASTTIDQNVLCGYGPCRWCPGFDYKYRSMERIDPFVSGTVSTNWNYNDNLIRNGKNATGTSLSATPKARNSRNYYIVHNGHILNSDKTLIKANSPYLVNDTVLVVNPGVTLTLEPGVVIKFYKDAGMSVQGRIISQGTETDPVVLTSFYDDDYGLDLNADATSTAPSPGGWYGVTILDLADSGSVFGHTIFRYGGKYYNGGGNSKANLRVCGVDVNIANSVFEHAAAYGLELVNSNSQVRDSIFRHNKMHSSAAGLHMTGGGQPLIENNEFISNGRGIVTVNGAQPSIFSNNFIDNFQHAIAAGGPLGEFKNNTGLNNGEDTIEISGNLTVIDSTTTLYPNSLPYVLSSSPKIVASSTLIIQSGVVIKGAPGLVVFGNLMAQGQSPQDVIFTSTGDDFSDSSTTPGYWRGIVAHDGSFVDLSGATVRFGGGYAFGVTNAGIYIKNAEVVLNNVVIENNRKYGVYLLNSTSTIKNAVFRNHLEPGGATAIAYYNSPIYLENVTFSNNLLAIYADPNSVVATVENINFQNNTATTSPEDLF